MASTGVDESFKPEPIEERLKFKGCTRCSAPFEKNGPKMYKAKVLGVTVILCKGCMNKLALVYKHGGKQIEGMEGNDK